MQNHQNIKSNYNDEALMERALNGDSSAFESLYDRYAGKLMRYAFQFTDDQMMAEDLVHETFVKILEKPETFDVKKKFSTWVYTVTGNLCRNYLRNLNNRQRINDTLKFEHTTEQKSDTLDAKQLRQKIKSLFKEMSDKEQDVFVLRFEMDLGIKEISEILRIPEGSVKSCLFYLLKKLVPHLNEYNYE